MEEHLIQKPREGEGSHWHDALLTFFNRHRLAPAQRRLARYIMDHPREAPFLSGVELASRVGVSQPSATRLAFALGYKRYAEFQKDLRHIILSSAKDKEGGDSNKFQGAVSAEIENLKALQNFLEDQRAVLEVGQSLAASDPLVVMGLRVSAPMASYFGQDAEKIHPGIQLITFGGSSAAERILQARQAGGQWALCFLLPRYPREMLEAMSFARGLGFQIATVADRMEESITERSDVVLPAGVGTRLVFDSQAAAMVLAGALLEAMSDARPERTQARLEDFEHLAAEMGWFVTE